MSDLITEDVRELILVAKGRMPKHFNIMTREAEGYYLELLVFMKQFSDFDLQDQIRIAETLNQLAEDIRKTGLPCLVQRV